MIVSAFGTYKINNRLILLIILEINPIRYKSYYYDIESNMYYLRSRYYNPLLARFITPDNYQYIDIEDYETYNLYTYSNNDSVNGMDPTGHFAITLTMIDYKCTLCTYFTFFFLHNIVSFTYGVRKKEREK